MYSALVYSGNKGPVLTQAKYGSASGTSSTTVTATAEYTGTGIRYWPMYMPSGETAITSECYSSTADSAICYEQLFTQSLDPNPKTPDWTNFVCPFIAGYWQEWSARYYAQVSGTGATAWIKSDSPGFRAFSTSTAASAKSAILPVDGVWIGAPYYPYESASALTSVSAKYSAETTGWMPISAIAGTETGELLAAVCVNMEMFNVTSFSTADNYANWKSGLYSALPPGCALSGEFVFRTILTGESASAQQTASYTYTYTGTAMTTATASSIVYNVPSGSATMTGIAAVEVL